MTEQYGSEAGAHETTGTEHESGNAGEGWHGDQPPVDDFADGDHAGAEGAATVSEDTETAENVVEDDQPKKKSSFGSMLVILIGLLLAGGMVYYQFFGGAALLKPQAVAVAHKPPSPVAPPPVASTPSVPPAPTPVAQPTPVTASNDISNLKPPSAAPAPQPSVTSAPPSVAMPSPSPVAAAAQPSPAVPSALDQAPSAQPAIPQGGMESQVNILTARVEAMQKSLAEANQQVAQLNGMITALQAAPGGPSATASMEDRLNKVEQDVLKLQQSPAASAAVTPRSPPPEALKPPVAHHTKPKAAATVKYAPRPAAKPTPVVPAVTTVSWVLRAATPGEAWVSQDASSSNLKHIQVGDDLPGIGHVTAIRQDQGRWVVEGSKGTIR